VRGGLHHRRDAALPTGTVPWSPVQQVPGEGFGGGVLGRAQKVRFVSSPLSFASCEERGRRIGLGCFCLQREERQYFDFFFFFFKIL